MKNHLPLVYGLIDAFLFLETAGSNEVEPGSSVRCMENMASSLLALDRADQLELRSIFEQIANEAEESRYAHFTRALPDMIRLAT
jgi:hypothetical protein